ncbi:glycine dehydrogenase [Psychroserpens ponticola]|uniref:Glycine dehydrogenase n=1 Tax=Psychroserpens ponticola TaxID=2932268 RepID=A0ABY7RVJ4_9FLAO|nr:glycine dehydrogenase [Psychroserpens ponticola]WCO00993.1 glycine dehydrogenase [Psychroserpens ponticola]
MSNKIFIPCKDANHVCDKTQYKEASLWEKIKLNIHLIYCRACRKYTKKNSQLTKLVTKDPIPMDASAKANLKSAFEQELAKHQ